MAMVMVMIMAIHIIMDIITDMVLVLDIKGVLWRIINLD